RLLPAAEAAAPARGAGEGAREAAVADLHAGADEGGRAAAELGVAHDDADVVAAPAHRLHRHAGAGAAVAERGPRTRRRTGGGRRVDDHAGAEREAGARGGDGRLRGHVYDAAPHEA